MFGFVSAGASFSAMLFSLDLALSVDENNVASNFDGNLFAPDSSDSNDDVFFTNASLKIYFNFEVLSSN